MPLPTATSPIHSFSSTAYGDAGGGVRPHHLRRYPTRCGSLVLREQVVMHTADGVTCLICIESPAAATEWRLSTMPFPPPKGP